MSSRDGTSPWLGKRVNLLVPMGVMRAVDVAQWALGARRPARPGRAGGPAGSAGSAAVTRWPVVYGVLVNLGVVLIVAGLAIVVSAHLFAIPVPLLVVVFALGSCGLLLVGVGAARRGSPAATIYCAWAALAFGLLVFAGAQVAGWTGFVPDLVLVWLAGVLAAGLAVPGTGLLTLTNVTLIGWVSLAYLYERSYLAAVAALVALYWAALRRPVSGVFVATLTLATVVVGGAYFHDVIRPGHYPLALSAGELLFVTAAVAAVGVLWAVTGGGGVVSTASRNTVRGFGYLLLGMVAVRPVWERVRDGFDHSGTALTAGIALLTFAAILLWSVPATPRDRMVFADAAVRFLLLAGALYGVPPGFGTVAPLLAAIALALIAYRLSVRGAARGAAGRALAGVLLLVVVAVGTLAGWQAPMEAVAVTLVVLGAVVLRIARAWHERVPAAETSVAPVVEPPMVEPPMDEQPVVEPSVVEQSVVKQPVVKQRAVEPDGLAALDMKARRALEAESD